VQQPGTFPVPEHGMPSPYEQPGTNGLAIASLILGLVGWVPCGLGSILAVVFGFVARRQIRDTGRGSGGDGLAIAGIVLGFLGILAWIVLTFWGALIGESTETR
jgi:hypothetical protein